MIYKFIFFLILGIDVTILFFQISNLSISSSELDLIYKEHSYISYLYHTLFNLFGSNDYTLRIPIIVMHIIDVYLFYEISKKYIKLQRERIWLILLFVMLPGTLSSALVLSHASFVLLGILFYIYLDQRIDSKYTNALLIIYTFIDGGFAYLILGVFIYNIFSKEYKSIFLNGLLLAISAYLYKLHIYGVPSGHFLDAIAVYSAIFTPIIFVYIVYSLYRSYLSDKIDKLWYVTTTTLIFSLLLSLRQRLDIEFFAPYLMIALPIAAQIFTHSYNVRLKMFRKRYKTIFVLSFLFLFANTLVVLFNKSLYGFIENPKKHFAYNMYVAKELASQLKQKDIICVTTNNKMQERIKFYGIEKCSDYTLKEISIKKESHSNVTISYNKRVVYRAIVTKIHKN